MPDESHDDNEAKPVTECGCFYEKKKSGDLTKSLRTASPEVMKNYLAMVKQMFYADTALPIKTKELIAIGVAHAQGCAYCIDIHRRGAKKAGATKEEIADAVLVAGIVCMGKVTTHSHLSLDD